jgi:hypothetical protein
MLIITRRLLLLIVIVIYTTQCMILGLRCWILLMKLFRISAVKKPLSHFLNKHGIIMATISNYLRLPKKFSCSLGHRDIGFLFTQVYAFALFFNSFASLVRHSKCIKDVGILVTSWHHIHDILGQLLLFEMQICLNNWWDYCTCGLGQQSLFWYLILPGSGLFLMT